MKLFLHTFKMEINIVSYSKRINFKFIPQKVSLWREKYLYAGIIPRIFLSFFRKFIRPLTTPSHLPISTDNRISFISEIGLMQPRDAYRPVLIWIVKYPSRPEFITVLCMRNIWSFVFVFGLFLVLFWVRIDNQTFAFLGCKFPEAAGWC